MDEINRTYSDDIMEVASDGNLPWTSLSRKNILITGATGLIGSCLTEILMSRPNVDYHVYASGRNIERGKALFSKYSQSPFFHFIKHDVTTLFDTDIDFNYIIHAASGANPVVYSKDPVGVMRANILGTDNLLQYGIKHNVEKFIFVSSSDVYGEGDGRVFTEDYSGYVDPLKLRSCYPSSKRAAETLCVSYAYQYGVDVRIVRPCHVYGPNFSNSDTRVYAQFIRDAINKRDIVLKSDGAQIRSWLYSVDCASAILYVLTKGKPLEAYNIADEKSIFSIKELADMIAKIAGCNVVHDYPSDIEKKGFNPVSQSILNVNKIKSLGWNVKSCPMEKFRKTIKARIKNENTVIA